MNRASFHEGTAQTKQSSIYVIRVPEAEKGKNG